MDKLHIPGMSGSNTSKLLIKGENHDMAIMKPLFGKGENMYLWAERGLVCIEDGRTNGYKTLSWREAGLRHVALSEMVHNAKKKSRTNSKYRAMYRNEIEQMIVFLEGLERVIRKAHDQGSPDSPDAGKWHKLSAKKQTVVPAQVNHIAGDVLDIFQVKR